MNGSMTTRLLAVGVLSLVALSGCYEGVAELDADPSVFEGGEGGESGDQTGVSTLSIVMDSTRVEVGQVVEVGVAARDEDGETVADVSPTWHTSSESVAAFQSPGQLEIVGAGDVEIWASLGDLESNRLNIVAEEVDPSETRYSLVEPRQFALGIGDTRDVTATVRRSDGRPVEGMEVEWASSDEAIATVDEKGTVEGISAGTASISAVLEDGESMAARVVVTDEATWMRPRLLRPASAIATHGEPIEVLVELREAALQDGYGTPLTPTSVEILVDGNVVGEASIEWDVSNWELDPTSLDAGLHRLSARLTYDGASYVTPERVLVVQEAPASGFADRWENLSEAPQERWALDDDLAPTNGNPPALAIGSQNTVYVGWEKTGRDRAQIYVHRWDEEDGRWRYLKNHEEGGWHGLQLRHWSSQYEYFPSKSAQFIDLAVDDQDRPLLTFTQEGVDTGGNGDERQKRWFDVFVARYEQGFGPNGTAGWRLLTSGAQDYIVSPPEAEDPQHPPPVDVDEHDDVFTPKVMWDGERSRVTVAWVSSPFPRQEAFLDVAYWSENNSTWNVVGQRLSLEASVPELRDAFIDGDGDIVTLVENVSSPDDARYEVWRLDVSESSWSRLDTSGRLLDVSPTPQNTLVGSTLAQGLLRGANLQSGVESSGGRILNGSAWVRAHEPVFARGASQPALVWFEGPTDSRQWIRAARYGDAGWESLDVSLFTRTRGLTRPSAAVGPDGRLVIVRQAPHTEKNNEFSMHVVRSLEPILD
jgi:hypothetical protein